MKTNSKHKKPALNRIKSGKFKHGCSGNPAGRPKGLPDKRTELRALLEPSKGRLIAKAVNLALNGDVAALRLCLERLIPVLKPTSEPIAVDIPAGTLSKQAEAIFRQVANGNLTGENAKELTELLTARLKIIEVEEMEKRLSELERHIKK